METHLPPELRSTDAGREAEAILRACVHCGFCTATCPTYRLLGDEDDGPRGRIYLMKHHLEHGSGGAHTLRHLDRCLTCRACETTCPSGVRYHRLLAITRPRLKHHRPLRHRLLIQALVRALPERGTARALLAGAKRLAPLLPAHLRQHLPPPTRPLPTLPARPAHGRVILFRGCVEPSAMANAHTAARTLLAHLGFDLVEVPGETCCGALEAHLDETERARARARRNLARWRPLLEDGVDRIVGLSSACVLQIREYPELLAGTPDEAAARQVAERTVELGQHLAPLVAAGADHPPPSPRQTVAWHPPCSLQHGLGDPHTIPRLLQRLGFRVLLPEHPHLCCGAAGAYTLLQPDISKRLGARKRATLDALDADVIATANVGCLLHLQRPDGPPVRHWSELFLEALHAETEQTRTALYNSLREFCKNH